MGPINLDKLINAISCHEHVVWKGGGGLEVSTSPSPYIPPKFRIKSTTAQGTTVAEKLAVEVIFVQAPAAVGKSITAKHISSLTNAPVLDLAITRVASSSLEGLIVSEALYNGIPNPTQSINDFHDGKSPVIVDALDEGQMVSTIGPFEAFLETTAKLILANRDVRNKPKVVFFGRPEATVFSDTAVQYEELEQEVLEHDRIQICIIELDFFTQEDATKLIKAYAEVAMEGSKNLLTILAQKQSPYDELIKWYFRRIEGALSIEKDGLWDDLIGKSFSGYAPVLSAIGRLLSKIRNPISTINDLEKEQQGRENAWSVIERVMQYILEREQDKVTQPLKDRFGYALDSDVLKKAYDPFEQLAYLAQLLQGIRSENVEPTNQVRFPVPQHTQVYNENIRIFCSDHAFMTPEGAANDIFESFILTHAVHSHLLQDSSVESRLEDLSKYPFLWRCFRRHINEEGPDSRRKVCWIYFAIILE